MSFPKRLAKVIKSIGCSKKLFAKKCGMSEAQLFNLLNGNNLPGAKLFMQMKLCYPDINLNWLISNQGNRCVNSNGIFHPLDDDPAIAELIADARIILTKKDHPVASEILERNIRYFAHTIKTEHRLRAMETKTASIEEHMEKSKKLGKRIRQTDDVSKKYDILRRRAL